jgi:hypothetical protein
VHCTDNDKKFDEIRQRRLLLLGGTAAMLAACSSPMPPPAAAPAPRPGGGAAAPALPSPGSARSWTELRLHAARRIVSANPSITYLSTPPDPLLAIPVLEIELNADGSIRHIDVLRHPRQAKDTVQIAMDAVRRAAPFGDVSRLPRPWKFAETFLFDDDRRFKPRALEP